MAKSEILIPFIKSWEGGFVNHPNDKGGATNKGITIGTFRSVYGQGKSVEDLKRITDAQWQYIFRRLYWNRWQADDIASQSIANLLVDWVWLSGRYGITIPQALLGVKVDGIAGPKTVAAINACEPSLLFRQLWSDRKAYIGMIASKPGQSVFLKGWMRRLNSIKYGRLECNGGKTLWC